MSNEVLWQVSGLNGAVYTWHQNAYGAGKLAEKALKQHWSEYELKVVNNAKGKAPIITEKGVVEYHTLQATREADRVRVERARTAGERKPVARKGRREGKVVARRGEANR